MPKSIIQRTTKKPGGARRGQVKAEESVPEEAWGVGEKILAGWITKSTILLLVIYNLYIKIDHRNVSLIKYTWSWVPFGCIH